MRKLYFVLFYIFYIAKASATPLQEKATFHDWSVFTTINEYLPNTCYALSTPYRTRALTILRNLPFMVVKHIEGNKYTISLTSGFLINKQYGVILELGNRDHRLVEGSNEFIWTSSYLQDRRIIEDLLEGEEYFKVRSFSSNNDSVLDYYSLIGFDEALSYMQHRCN